MVTMSGNLNALGDLEDGTFDIDKKEFTPINGTTPGKVEASTVTSPKFPDAYELGNSGYEEIELEADSLIGA